MRPIILPLIVLTATSVGIAGCSQSVTGGSTTPVVTTPTGGVNAQNVVDAIVTSVKTSCKFVPTASTVANLVEKTVGSDTQTVDYTTIAVQLASVICAATDTPAAVASMHRGAAVIKVKGVTITGYFLPGAPALKHFKH